jgi:uncharacterized protein
MGISVMNRAKQTFQFPCSYPLKVVGANTNEFYAVVSAVIEKHAGENEQVLYHSRISSGGKYLSVTATFRAQSREQLDRVYRELTGNKLVLMAL